MRIRFAVSLIVALISSNQILAQAPQGINYQGVARGLDGQPIAHKEIAIRVSVLNGSSNGELEYDEIHEVKTNSFGLFTLVIGQGTPGTNSFNFIGWTTGKKWLQIEMDENGGRNFKLMGSQQLMSVPYALYAERSGNGYQAGQGINISNNMISNVGDGDSDATNELNTSVSFGPDNKLRITDGGGTKEADLSGLLGAAQNLSNVLTQGNSAGNTAITNLGTPIGSSDAATKSYVDAHVDGDADATNELQDLSEVLSQNNDAGNSRITNLGAPTTNSDAATKLYVDNLDASDGDKNATNEIQSLSKSGSNISLSNGGGSVTLNDDNATNEIQSLSKAGSTISLSIGGGSVTLNDDSPTNELQSISTQSVDANTRSLSLTGSNTINVDVSDADASAINEAQSISRSGSNVTLTQVAGIGGGTISVDDADANPTNEAQTISKSGATVSLSNVSGVGGGSFILNDDSGTNEAQTISRSGNNVTLTQVSGVGGGSFIIDDADASTTNEAQTISRTGATVTLTQASGVGGGSFSVNDADADPANELQNLDQVLNTGNSAGNKKMIDLADPTQAQDATTKKYVDDADAVLSSKISTTYAFKATFDYTNLTGSVLNDQSMPFMINPNDFDDFGVLSGTNFTATEAGTYVFYVEGIYNTTLSGGSLSVLFNSVKYPVTIVLPFGATQPRFSGTFMFKLIAGETISVVGDNIAVNGQFIGKFFGNKL